MKDKKIGFVGVGRMGANMARRLADVGYEVSVVFDAQTSVAEELAEELKCAAAKSLPEVSAAADVIFTVVSDEEAMRSIFTAKDSLVVGAEGKVFINCATVSPATHEAAVAAAMRVGASGLAVCMASSIPQARNGELYLIVGGEDKVYQRVKPILEELSASLRHVGTAGDAAKVKALVNMVMNINTAGLAEGLGLAAAMGLDLAVLKEVFSQTGANSRVLATDGDDMVDRDHDCYFSAAHAAKDSGIANVLAKESGVAVPLSDATEGQYCKLMDMGLGDLDKSGVAELTFPNRGGRDAS